MRGLAIRIPDPATVIDLAMEADRAGVESVWLQSDRISADPLSFIAGLASRTERLKFATAVVPTWPRHPVVLTQQVMAIEALAPGRFTLGIGPSTAGAMRPFGVEFRKPATQLREYLQVLRSLLHEGQVDFQGEFVRARARIAAPLQTPVLASALQAGTFEACGEFADGAITWLCPVDYVRSEGVPALARGAARAGREPGRIALHVPLCRSSDPEVVTTAATQVFGPYTQYQFYKDMFQAAGHPSGDEPRFTPELASALVVSGTDEEILERLDSLEAGGVTDLMITPIGLGTAEEATRDALPLLARASGR